jgi:hypothetical protein
MARIERGHRIRKPYFAMRRPDPIVSAGAAQDARFLHFNKWRILLVIVFLAATLARILAESHERLKMKKLSVLLCLSAAVLIIVRRPKRNHPGETLSTEEDCSWLNHGGFPTKG